jgi:tetratricopeptide (TPR) repeat protein
MMVLQHQLATTDDDHLVEACQHAIDTAMALPESAPTSDLIASVDSAMRIHRKLVRRQPGTAGRMRLPLQAKLVQLLARRAELLRARGLHERAIAYLEKALDIDPVAEHCRRQLLLLNQALERNAAILETFAPFRRRLGVAIGV